MSLPLYFDQHAPLPVAPGLRWRGPTFQTVEADGRKGPDDETLKQPHRLQPWPHIRAAFLPIPPLPHLPAASRSPAVVFSSYIFDVSGIRPGEVTLGQAFSQTISTTGAVAGPLFVGVTVGTTGSLMTALCLICAAHLTFLLATLIPKIGWQVRLRPAPVTVAP